MPQLKLGGNNTVETLSDGSLVLNLYAQDDSEPDGCFFIINIPNESVELILSARNDAMQEGVNYRCETHLSETDNAN